MKREPRKAVIHCSCESPFRDGLDAAMLPDNCEEILRMYPEGVHLCGSACLGGGSCVSVCPKDAISIVENADGIRHAHVNREQCIGCGRCAKVCPQHLITLEKAVNTIQPLCENPDSGKDARKECAVSCIACRICEKNCPSDAVHLIDNHAVIDGEACIACGMCASKCPRGVLHDAFGIIAASF